jgi:hypothetical protein
LPWCDDCSKFWNQPELVDGSCPRCGRSLVREAAPVGGIPLGATTAEPGADGARTSAARPPTRAKGAPWHFKLLVVGVAGYMVYRIYWLIEWLPKHL